MIKKTLGFALLTMTSFAAIYFIYGVFSNPNSLLLFKKLVTGEFGLSFTIVIIGIHLFSLLVLSFKTGMKWMNFFPQTKLRKQ